MIQYPDYLPLPLVDGRQNKQVEQIMRTQMQSGRSRQRLAFESVPELCSVAFVFNSDSQALAFELWFKQVLVVTNWFEIKLRFTDGLSARVARFTGIYSGPNPVAPGLWSITGELELRENHIDSSGVGPDYGEFPYYIIDANLLDVIMNNQWSEV